MFKKLSLFLLAVLFVMGCSIAPKVVLGAGQEEEEEEIVARPQWAVEAEERQAKKAEEKKKELEEYEKTLAVQQKERPAPEKVNKEDCKINGHDCWQVLKIFIPGAKTSAEEQAAELKKLGLTIKDSVMIRNGSKFVYLSDGTDISILYNSWDKSHNLKVKLKDGRSITYDTEGYQVKLPFPEYDSLVFLINNNMLK